MKYLDVSHEMQLVLEQTHKNLRLVVSRDEEELACHKVSLKDFKLFLDGGLTHLFKGRLQLHNKNGAIILTLKGNEIGVVHAADIVSMLD